MESPRITLALETAVDSGSISLVRDNCVIASACGTSGISRAEDLIVSIDRTLTSAGLTHNEIDVVAVSNGPGSYTGIRIGLATAMGIAESVRARLFTVNLLEAMRIETHYGSAWIAAVPMGREDVAWRQFAPKHTPNSPDEVNIGTFLDFVEFLAGTTAAAAILHSRVFNKMDDIDRSRFEAIELVDSGENLAKFIGLAASSKSGRTIPEPIYLLNRARGRGLF